MSGSERPTPTEKEAALHAGGIMDEPEALNIRALIYERSSLHFPPSRLHQLERQLATRMAQSGLQSLGSYCETLRTDDIEFASLMDDLTTKETFFFRIPEQFRALRERVLPEIEERLSDEIQSISSRNGGLGTFKIPLRVWCAGCSTGEEAYSLAMTFLEGLRFPRAWDIDLLATDISESALAAAAAGWYSHSTLRKVPADLREKYVEKHAHGGAMAPALRRFISFRTFNLRELPVGPRADGIFRRLDGSSERLALKARFDIVFCRNVMIYFDFPAQQRLVEGLAASLVPGGHLFLGDAEFLHSYRHGFQAIDHGECIYYRNPGGETHTTMSTPR